MVYSQSRPQQIDREQVQQQLAALGYKGGDTVYLRAFYPPNDPRKDGDGGRKEEATNLDRLIQIATKFQAEGRGIYFVVNGGGHANKNVTCGRAIFYEHDNLDKAAQVELWKGLGLPEPSLQIDTGGKSVHSYWIFAGPIAIEKWLPLQTDLLEFADADRSIKNASRVMRLAGAWHTSGKQSVIINNSGKRYTYDELRSLVPAQQKPEPTIFQAKPQAQVFPISEKPDCYENVRLPVPMPVPLLCALGETNKGFLQGVSTQRNTSMATLARDLIGTAKEFARLGQTTNEDAYTLFIDACRRCSPGSGWGEKEWEGIWKSAEDSNPSPSVNQASPKAVENCIKGWYWREFGKKPGSNGETKSNVVPLFPTMLFDLRAELTKLIKMGTAGSELTEAILGLANGGNPQTIWRIYHEISEEIECADERLDRKRDIENLINISNRRLTLENYLHPSLAEPIKKVATWMGVDPEAVLTHLLPIVAGLINPNSRIVAKECTNFVEPFLIYSGVVALSGARKTPTLNIPKNPLVRLQSVEDARYQQAIQMYDAEVQTLKATQGQGQRKDSSGELPQKPNPPREFYLDNATVEAVDKVKGQQPDHGLTLIKDELSGLFASHGAYKGGKGADKESYLSGWNGGGVKKNRSGDGSRVSLARDSLSITGGIQPDKLRALLGDFSDSQGEWARFLWYHMPMRPYKIPRDDTRYDLGDLLEGIYKKIDALPVLKLHFDKQGQAYWDDWHDKKDEQKRGEARPGLQAAIAKIPGQSVRLIGVLHVLREVASGSSEIREEIPVAVVKSGIKLAEFYLGQVTLLQVDGDTDTGEVSPVLKKLLDKLNEFKTLTARQAIQTIRDLKQIKAPKVREFFAELKAMGLAEIQGTGTRMVLVQKVLTTSEELQKHQKPCSIEVVENNTSKVLASVDEVLTSKKDSKTVVESAFQEEPYQSVDTVDTFETFDSIPPSIKASEPIDISDLSRKKPGITNEIVNTSTDGTESLSLYEVKGVDTPSTLDVNTSKNVNTPQEESIAPPEPAPPEPALSPAAATPAAETELADAINDMLAVETWTEAKSLLSRMPELGQHIKESYPDEYKRIGRLKGKAVRTPGTRVKYVGKDQTHVEQLGGLELKVVEYKRDPYGYEVTCAKPDGSYTTWLKPGELEPLC